MAQNYIEAERTVSKTVISQTTWQQAEREGKFYILIV